MSEETKTPRPDAVAGRLDGLVGHDRTLIAEFPMVCCPHCGKEQQWDDCYDLHAGSSRDCQHCEKEIHVLSTDTVIYARLSTVPNAAVHPTADRQGEKL